MEIKIDDILKLRRLTSDNRVIVHNLAYNELSSDKKIELFDTFDNRNEEINSILFKYYKNIFFR